MSTLLDLKESDATLTPLLLFDCSFSDGSTTSWCTQGVTVFGTVYDSRVCRNNIFEVQTATDQGVDTIPKLTIELANSDSVLSEIERNKGFKGARLKCSFVFYDSVAGNAGATPIVLFQGICNSPDFITESILRVTAINRLSAQRVVLPSQRIQRRCSWTFPANTMQRAEAVGGGQKGERSRFYGCGYSADQPGGAGNLNGAQCFTSCSYSRQDCEQRGMFNADSRGMPTKRFSGIEFVPSTITVRSAGEKSSHASPVSVNDARYNDFVPIVYGTAWYTPSIVFARNDGNLTRMEVLLGVGEMEAVHKVLVSDIDIPTGRSGLNMTGTGWFNLVTPGTRNGSFNLDFTDATGAPLGDPYGGLALLSVVVPNRINDGKSLPEIKVLADGLKLATYDLQGNRLSSGFTGNPAWVILDVLLRNGWNAEEIDLSSFASAANYCDEQISVIDLHGNQVSIPRFQCNLVLKSRRSAGDVLRGIRNNARLFLTFGTAGLLQLRSENTLAVQQPNKSEFSNAADILDGGWPAYEFGDGTNGTSGIMRTVDGGSSLRITSRGASDTPNRLSIEFQDAFNEYQQDSFSLTDTEDVDKAGQEINGVPAVLGIPNYHQAARTLQFLLSKSISGNLQVEFQTSVKALGLAPGDLISLTYLREGFQRQAFRIVKVAPGQNFRTATLTAQIHDDAWYSDLIIDTFGYGRRLPSANIGIPRPLSGIIQDDNGLLAFVVVESTSLAQDGTSSIILDVEVTIPPSVAEQAPGIPIIGLTPDFDEHAGGFPPGDLVYYAVSAVNITGDEGPISFVVRVQVPASFPGYSVTLTKLSFSADTVSFHVYRGPSPAQLNRIATATPLATFFIDSGLQSLPILPPDNHFHHSNLYWRLEVEGEVNANIHSDFTVGNNALMMLPNAYTGFAVRILKGPGSGQERLIASNTEAVLTISTGWDIEPGPDSLFVVSQAALQSAATGKGTRFEFEVPNREGTVVQIVGRSANAAGAECPLEISPLTRWKIGGAGIKTVDASIPAAPFFALATAPSINGTLVLSAVSFPVLANTATIIAGTLTMYWQDELDDLRACLLASLEAESESLKLSGGSSIQPGSLLRLNSELMRVDAVGPATDELTVFRAQFDTLSLSADLGTTIVLLRRTTITVPFIRNFFGTPASGDWSYTIALENARLAAAEFYVTNSQGNSPVTEQAYTNTIDNGLRTLSGGQYSLQVSGALAIQESAAPDTVIETGHVIGEITAFLGESPTGSGVQIRINLNSNELCMLTFSAGSQTTAGLRGADLPALREGDRLSIDVIAVGAILPGADLTITVRV